MEKVMKQNAKTAIINSFKELLNKKSLDKITVTGICEHCDVNRQSFYNYFSDIMDIFKCIFYDELSQEIAQNRTFETWGGGFLATMHYFKKNSKMILHVYNSSYWSEANIYISELINSANYLNKILTHITGGPERNLAEEIAPISEDFDTSIEDYAKYMIQNILAESNIPPERMNAEEKMEIVKRLDEKGVFLIKGSVTEVAKHLKTSDNTIYRYLNK